MDLANELRVSFRTLEHFNILKCSMYFQQNLPFLKNKPLL